MSLGYSKSINERNTAQSNFTSFFARVLHGVSALIFKNLALNLKELRLFNLAKLCMRQFHKITFEWVYLNIYIFISLINIHEGFVNYLKTLTRRCISTMKL